MSKTQQPTPNLPAVQPAGLLSLGQILDPRQLHGSIGTSLSLTDPTQKRMLRRHLAGETSGKDEYINKELALVHVTCHPASSPDDITGEIRNFTRTVLQCEDGTCIALGSDGILKSIHLLQLLERPAPWNPPLRCVLKQQPTKSGGIWLTLEPVDVPVEPARKGR